VTASAGTAASGATAAVTESNLLTFSTLANGNSVTINGLTFKNTSGATLSASAVAALFANIADNTAAATLTSASGKFTGFSTGWTSGAVASDVNGNPTVTFTSTTAGTPVTDMTASTSTASYGATNGLNVAAAKTDGVTGVAAAAAVAGNVGVSNGNVTVSDAVWDAVNTQSTALGTISSVKSTNYAALTVNSAALTTLTASGGANIDINNASTVGSTQRVTTLGLALNGVSGTFTDDNIYKTLNVTATGAASSLTTISDTALEAINVSGDKVLTIGTINNTGLKTVTVTGTAGVTSTTLSKATVTSVDASGTSGAMTVTIDSTTATYAGSSGADVVTLSAAITAAAANKAISLGAGDDTLILASAGGVQFISATIQGGAGVNTVSMTAVDAAATSAAAFNASSFNTGLVDFTTLKIDGTAMGAAKTVDVAALGFGAATDTINVAGTSHALTLSTFANGQSLVVSAANSGGIDISTLMTGAADVANVTVGHATGGTITATGAETVNLNITASSASVTLADAGAIVNLTGKGGTLVLSSAVKSVDASAATSALVVDASALGAATGGSTLTGTAFADNLKAGTGVYTLNGGAGADTLTANSGAGTLTGGAGFDNFVVATAGTSASVYSKITDLGYGDKITLKDQGNEVWNATKLATVNDGLTFGAALNAAIGTTNDTDAKISWFQWQGNTYIVQALADHTANANTFVAGTDIVLQLNGLVDLSTSGVAGNVITFG
jgi:S-layer protein